jgi:methylated-DNA-[protein]-cysteine S-methyltransferase
MNGLTYYSSPVGELAIRSEGDSITAVEYLQDLNKQPEHITPVIQQCMQELDEYFVQRRKFFDVNLKLIGTDFQQKVWTQLLEIPYGKTTYYADIAVKVGDLNAVRAVGLANGQNPIAILVPCHRVIGKDGSMIGYGGGLDRKEWLLRHEGALNQLEIF